MGMFDDIEVHCPLPGDCPFSWFQTKSLDLSLSRFMITEDGRLMRGIWPWKDGKYAPLGFTGAVTFYGDNQDDIGVPEEQPPYEWWEYTALFEHGKMLGVVGGRRE